MKLYYQILGTGRPLIIVHGLFGSSDNWKALAKQLSQYVKVITVDLRNHGRSPQDQEQNYRLMADDLVELLNDLHVNDVDIIGHSVGGKVAMAFSQYYPKYVRKLVVVDISPREYESEHTAIFDALLALDLSKYTSRNEVDRILAADIPNQTVRLFLLMNLEKKNGLLMWRINLQALYHNYSQFLQAVCENTVISISSCFIRGGKSAYIQQTDQVLIKKTFPESELHTIEQAGHWVHADASQPFLSKVIEFFDYD